MGFRSEATFLWLVCVSLSSEGVTACPQGPGHSPEPTDGPNAPPHPPQQLAPSPHIPKLLPLPLPGSGHLDRPSATSRACPVSSELTCSLQGHRQNPEPAVHSPELGPPSLDWSSVSLDPGPSLGAPHPGHTRTPGVPWPGSVPRARGRSKGAKTYSRKSLQLRSRRRGPQEVLPLFTSAPHHHLPTTSRRKGFTWGFERDLDGGGSPPGPEGSWRRVGRRFSQKASGQDGRKPQLVGREAGSQGGLGWGSQWVVSREGRAWPEGLPWHPQKPRAQPGPQGLSTVHSFHR